MGRPPQGQNLYRDVLPGSEVVSGTVAGYCGFQLRRDRLLPRNQRPDLVLVFWLARVEADELRRVGYAALLRAPFLERRKERLAEMPHHHLVAGLERRVDLLPDSNG